MNNDLSNITCVIPTRNRSNSLQRLLDSIRSKYCSMAITIVNNGDTALELNTENVSEIQVPSNAGISHARNVGVNSVLTEYLLLLDDDFEFTDKTDIEGLLSFLQQGEYDLAGSKLTFVGSEEYRFDGSYHFSGKNLIHKIDGEHTESGSRDVIFQACLVRRAVFDRLQWDNELKKACEHDDLFLQIKRSGFRVGYYQDCEIDHIEDQKKDHGLSNSLPSRNRFLEKWGISRKIEVRESQSGGDSKEVSAYQVQPTFSRLDELPPENRENRCIFMSVDNNFTPLAVKMLRTMRTSWVNHPEVVIVHPEDLSNQNKTKLKEAGFVSLQRIELDPYLVGPVMDHLKDTGLDPSLFYARFMIWAHEAFSKYDQVLHLDSDLQIRSNLDHFFDDGIGVRITEDVYTGSEYINEEDQKLLSMLRDDNIPIQRARGNAGVFRVNRLGKTTEVLDLIVEFIERYGEHIRFADQSILNMVNYKLGIDPNQDWVDNYQELRMSDSPEVFGNSSEANIVHYNGYSLEERLRIFDTE